MSNTSGTSNTLSTVDASNEPRNEDGKSTEEFINSMIAFADNPLKTLIAMCENKTIDERWGSDIMVDTGCAIIECKNGKKYNLSLGVVNKDYEMDMTELQGESSVLKTMSYLIHCVLSLFKLMKVGTRTLKVDMEKSTLYFHSQDQHRIGILISIQ